MTDLESSLKSLIATTVREEVRRELALQQQPDEWLSTAAAARLYGLSPVTIRRWVHAHRLTRYAAGRLLRVSRVELERLVRYGIPANGQDLTPEQEAAKRFG